MTADKQKTKAKKKVLQGRLSQRMKSIFETGLSSSHKVPPGPFFPGHETFRRCVMKRRDNPVPLRRCAKTDSTEKIAPKKKKWCGKWSRSIVECRFVMTSPEIV